MSDLRVSGPKLLTECWKLVQDATIDEDYAPDMKTLIARILRSKTQTYRYMGLVQVLAHAAEPELDARCLQTTCKHEGSFDARSFASKVVASWERESGGALGQSNDPYVSNPARLPEIDTQHKSAMRDGQGYDDIIALVNHCQQLQRDASVALLKQVLIEYRRLLQEQKIQYPSPKRISLPSLMNAIDKYLSEPSGGVRLQALVLAVALTEKDIQGYVDELRFGSINEADKGEKAGDIELWRRGAIVGVLEAKEMSLTMGLLEDKLRSCRASNASELTFVIKSKTLGGDEVFERAERAYDSGLNVYLCAAMSWLMHHLRELGETGRAIFVGNAGQALEEMRADFRHRKAWEQLVLEL